MSAVDGHSAPSIGVLIVDDQALVRAGFRMILEIEPDLHVVGEAADGDQAVAQVAALGPDVVLMDVRMPGTDGIAATRRIMADASCGARVVMLTTFDMDEYVYEALKAGASGFLLKDVQPELLVAGIRAVHAGESLLAPTVTRRMIESFLDRPRAVDARARERLASLTAREQETLRLLARGLTNAEIAADLYVSETTVKTHVGRVLMKLGVRDRVQAVIYAYETGVVSSGPQANGLRGGLGWAPPQPSADRSSWAAGTSRDTREDLKPTPTPAAEPLTRWSHPALFKLGRRWAWYRCRVLLMPVRTGSSRAPG